MLTVVVVLGVLGILFGSAALATYEGQVLRDPAPDDRDSGLPEAAVQPEDVAEVRFDMALRGYRMAEVDAVLGRLSGELAARDQKIRSLQDALASVVEPTVSELERATSHPPIERLPPTTPAPVSAAEPAWSPSTSWTPAVPWVAAPVVVPEPVEALEALETVDDDAFGFPEVPLPDAADGDLPDATDQSVSGAPDVVEPWSSGWEQVGTVDQQAASPSDVHAPITSLASSDVSEPEGEDLRTYAGPPLGVPGEGDADLPHAVSQEDAATPSGEHPTGH